MKTLLKTTIKKAKLYQWYLKYRVYLMLVKSYRYDRHRFGRQSLRKTWIADSDALELQMMLEYHKIEKGLCFREFRPGFGKEPISALITLLAEYRKKFVSSPVAVHAAQALLEYLEVHRALDYDLGDRGLDIEAAIRPYLENLDGPAGSGCGGTHTISRKEILDEANNDFASLMATRHSIRDFSEKPVPIDLIERAIQIAMKTPSVCNRQGWAVHLFSEPDRVRQVLSCQGGHRGFTDAIDKVAVIGADLRKFPRVRERNQAFVDGGLFSMSFVLALHSLGIGTCTLSCALSPKADRKLRETAGIPDHEVIIMMIAMGHYPEKLKVCAAARKPWRNIARLDGQPWPESSG